MKKIFSLLFLSALMFCQIFAISTPVLASDGPDLWGDQQDEVQNELGYTDTQDPRVIAAGIIRTVLSFLGIIAVGLIIWAGFNWMTAAGNEEKIEKAKKTLTAAVIGLVIILAAWGLANFLVEAAREATT